MQVDITSLASKLEHVEREVVGHSQSIVHHLHCAISRVGTAAQKQEKIYDGTASNNKESFSYYEIFVSQTLS